MDVKKLCGRSEAYHRVVPLASHRPAERQPSQSRALRTLLTSTSSLP